MRILFDIGHPFHVHFFKNLIKWLENEGHEYRVLARDKDLTYQLLNAFHIPFSGKGKGGTGFIDRIVYTLKSIRIIDKMIRSFEPDLCVSHPSPYLALMSFYHNKPHILFNDSEKEFLFHYIMKYCKSDVYLTDSYRRLGKNYHRSLPSFMELAYLHPDHYKPNNEILNITGENYVLIRFVSNTATHDKGHKGLTESYKREMVEILSENKQVWISSEIPLTEDLNKYKLAVPPEKIHDVIAFADLVVGESATMSSEAAMLGVPAVLISHNQWGYIRELSEKYKLVHYYKTDIESRKAALQKMVECLNDNSTKDIYRERRQTMLSDKQNMTEIMIDIINQAVINRMDSKES